MISNQRSVFFYSIVRCFYRLCFSMMICLFSYVILADTDRALYSESEDPFLEKLITDYSVSKDLRKRRESEGLNFRVMEFKDVFDELNNSLEHRIGAWSCSEDVSEDMYHEMRTQLMNDIKMIENEGYPYGKSWVFIYKYMMLLDFIFHRESRFTHHCLSCSDKVSEAVRRSPELNFFFSYPDHWTIETVYCLPFNELLTDSSALTKYFAYQEENSDNRFVIDNGALVLGRLLHKDDVVIIPSFHCLSYDLSIKLAALPSVYILTLSDKRKNRFYKQQFSSPASQVYTEIHRVDILLSRRSYRKETEKEAEAGQSFLKKFATHSNLVRNNEQNYLSLTVFLHCLLYEYPYYSISNISIMDHVDFEKVLMDVLEGSKRYNEDYTHYKNALHLDHMNSVIDSLQAIAN